MKRLYSILLGLLLLTSLQGQILRYSNYTLPPGEPPQNLLRYSEDLSNAAWLIAGAVTVNQEDDLDGNPTMDMVEVSNWDGECRYEGGAGENNSVVVSASTTYRFSFDVIRGTLPDLKWKVVDYSNSYVDIIARTSYYSQTSGSVQRVSLEFATPVGCTEIVLWFHGQTGEIGTAYFGRFQLEENGSAYVKTEATPIP